MSGRISRFSAAPPQSPTRTSPPVPAADSVVPRRNFLARALTMVGAGALLGGVPRAIAAPAPPPSTQAAEPFIGEIMIFAGNFAPRGWALCDGQLLPISQNTALFSILGTMYGGNGVTTFGLPDLRGRVPLHAGGGPGPGLPSFQLGQMGGEVSHTLLAGELPAHTHTVFADTNNGTQSNPDGAFPARNPAGIPAYGAGATAQMAPGTVQGGGSNLPHNNMQPYLGLNYCIALEGIYPSRS